jgi:hypothetical protein
MSHEKVSHNFLSQVSNAQLISDNQMNSKIHYKFNDHHAKTLLQNMLWMQLYFFLNVVERS